MTRRKGQSGAFQKTKEDHTEHDCRCCLFSLEFAVFVLVVALIIDVLLEEIVFVGMLVVVVLMILFL